MGLRKKIVTLSYFKLVHQIPSYCTDHCFLAYELTKVFFEIHMLSLLLTKMIFLCFVQGGNGRNDTCCNQDIGLGFIWWRCSRWAFRWTTANNVSGRYFHHYFYFFLSILFLIKSEKSIWESYAKLREPGSHWFTTIVEISSTNPTKMLFSTKNKAYFCT